METVLNKLQEGVKYPRFERDATRIINDLVTHITNERGVYSSSIEPNPNEHKVWFNTNTNTLNIYDNGRWNTISGGGSGGGNTENLSGVKSISMVSGSITGVKIINMNSGLITGVTGISLVSGSNVNRIAAIASGIAFNGLLTDTTLFHSIDLSKGDIKGANTIKAYYNGLTIEPINDIYTGKPIVINGKAAGLNISVNDGADFTIDKVKIINMNSGIINGIDTITFGSGSNAHIVRAQGNVIAYNGTLSDTTLMHSIDFVYGNVKGIKSIKGDWSGFIIEPINDTYTGKPITIHGRAAGLSLGANSTAPFAITGISSIGWKMGTSNGYGMTFNVNDNIINSTRDTYNINNGSITLTNETITGSANVNLTLYGTISGATISGGIINGALISDCHIENAYINTTGGQINNTYFTNGFINGDITISGILNGGIISGATISGGTISGGAINNVTIGTGNALLYAGSKVLVTYTGSNSNPILIPNGGNIGNNSSSLTLCGVTLTGGDFTKLKNLQ